MNQAALASNMSLTYQEFLVKVATQWELPCEVTTLLRKYFLRKWHTSNLEALIRDGMINYEGINYQVKWYGGKVKATSQVMVSMSFRATYDIKYSKVLVKMTSDSLALGEDNA